MKQKTAKSYSRNNPKKYRNSQNCKAFVPQCFLKRFGQLSLPRSLPSSWLVSSLDGLSNSIFFKVNVKGFTFCLAGNLVTAVHFRNMMISSRYKLSNSLTKKTNITIFFSFTTSGIVFIFHFLYYHKVFWCFQRDRGSVHWEHMGYYQKWNLETILHKKTFEVTKTILEERHSKFNIKDARTTSIATVLLTGLTLNKIILVQVLMQS